MAGYLLIKMIDTLLVSTFMFVVLSREHTSVEWAAYFGTSLVSGLALDFLNERSRRNPRV